MIDSEENYKFDLGSINLSQNFCLKPVVTCNGVHYSLIIQVSVVLRRTVAGIIMTHVSIT